MKKFLSLVEKSELSFLGAKSSGVGIFLLFVIIMTVIAV